MAEPLLVPAPKGLPESGARAVVGRSLFDGTFPLPVAVLRDDALTANIATMARFTDDAGALLAPHAKTTMSPQIVARQLDAGAWGMTAATAWQAARVAEMGVDRIYHGFWQFMDKNHHRYEPGNKFEHAIRDYHIHLDGLIGELLSVCDREKTAVMLVSDHGAKCMVGGLCFNDWLIREGYMALKQPVSKPTKFDFGMVDWSRTRAWGEGGYYGRCFLNVQGREPQGIVPQEQYEALRDELIRKLEAMNDHEGKPLGTRVYKPQEIYRKVNGVAPDMIVIFGDLRWRSVGTVGNPDIYTFENDTGPDDANHAQMGMYTLTHPSLPAKGRADGASIYDIAPTILKLLGVTPPGDMIGRPLVG